MKQSNSPKHAPVAYVAIALMCGSHLSILAYALWKEDGELIGKVWTVTAAAMGALFTWAIRRLSKG